MDADVRERSEVGWLTPRNGTLTRLRDTYWHDGRFVQATLRNDESHASVRLDLHLYEQERSSERSLFVIDCRGVTRFECTVDVLELRDHAWAGNIIDGKQHGRTLRIELCGGFVEIEADAFELQERAS